MYTSKYIHVSYREEDKTIIKSNRIENTLQKHFNKMSIPRRARIFGQPTKLQRDRIIILVTMVFTNM